ncbi:MAG: type IV pili twitching motility protein PilT, partial [Firmicutes bacterium]|nr:type IV pili twitching motility protein PilT [Bacillota bacterium]
MGDNSNYPITMDALRTLAVERNASDVHLAPGAPPLFRINRTLVQLEDQPVLTPK